MISSLFTCGVYTRWMLNKFKGKYEDYSTIEGKYVENNTHLEYVSQYESFKFHIKTIMLGIPLFVILFFLFMLLLASIFT